MASSERFRRRVVQRARNRCEYCGLSQLGQAATFHLDHISPQAAGGKTLLGNLALACVHCSLRKGARTVARDPKTGRTVALFHPRNDTWNHHFRWSGCRLAGISDKGRATVAALTLNSSDHLVVRSFESQLGRHPPPGHL